ncbi:MAG: hypothetical protein U9O64_10630 [Campylobacterota bacterium]|nr:hypothetical protein [Campylobacterota bacterium]
MQFNKSYADKNVSVSKSYVYSVIKENGYEVVKQRREIKHNIPKTLPKNVQRSLDLTTIKRK